MIVPLPQRRLLTVAEYLRLGEDDRFRTELQGGSLVLSPSNALRHQLALGELCAQLQDQVPTGLELLPGVDLDLELVPPDEPGWSRLPDLVVVDDAAFDRCARERAMLRATEVVLVVEIVSPGSARMDHVVKRREYADAGIPHYWIVDLDPPVRLQDCQLGGESGYQDGGSVTGTFETSAPFPAKISLDALV